MAAIQNPLETRGQIIFSIRCRRGLPGVEISHTLDVVDAPDASHIAQSLTETIAVVGTLIYVALEVHANTKALRSSNSHDTLLGWQAYNQLLTEHSNAELMARSMDPEERFENFNQTERFIVGCACRGMFQGFASNYSQFLSGNLEPELWNHEIQWARSVLEIPVFATWWEIEKSGAQWWSDGFAKALDRAPVTGMTVGMTSMS